MFTNGKILFGASTALALAMVASSAVAAPPALGGTVDGTAASTTTTNTTTTNTTGDSTVAPYTNTTTTVQAQTVTSTTPTTTDATATVTINGVVYNTSRTVAGAGTATQDSTSTLVNTYNPGPPPTLASSVTTGPVVTATGTPVVTSVSATGFAGDANSQGQMSFGSTLSTSGAVTAGTVVATENAVNVTTSGTTYSTYVGTATYSPSTGDVTVTLPSTATRSTSISSSGLSTSGTIAANVGGVAGAAAIDAGGGRIVNLAAGTAATDAVNVGQLNAAVSGLNSTVGLAFASAKKRAEAGTAIAVALGGAAFLPNHKFNLTANVGTYRGETAIAGQLGILVSDNLALNAGVATSFHSYGGTAARAGLTVGF